MATWHDTPREILKHIRELESGVESLGRFAKKVGLKRKFTLDGRLVGDIGELVVYKCFADVSDEKPPGLPHVHDLGVKIHGKLLGVQVKLRRSGKTAKLQIKYRPDILIILGFKDDWSAWRIIFNGCGSVVLGNAIKEGPKRRLQSKNNQPVEVGLSLADFSDKQRNKKFSTPSLRLIK